MDNFPRGDRVGRGGYKEVEMNSTGELLNGNSYPGRGIVAGTTPSGKAVFAWELIAE